MRCDASCRNVNALALASAASLLELGPIVESLRQGAGVMPALLAGLAYQIGNVAPRFFTLGQHRVVGAAVVFGAVAVATAQTGSLLWLVGISTLSWALQDVRRSVSVGSGSVVLSTARKRVARVVGFIAASMMPFQLLLLAVCAALAAATPLIFAVSKAGQVGGEGFGNRLEWIMIIHQTHYFAYAYAVPLLLANNALGGTPLVGIWFACGWISYLSAEHLWRRWKPTLAFVAGHLMLAIVLSLLSGFSNHPYAALALWIASGFGGGTVYCLSLLHKQADLIHARLEFAEDVGHVLGAAVAIAGISLFDLKADALPGLGAAFAAIAAGVMAVTSVRAALKNTDCNYSDM